ncbi:MAG: putative transport system ATP-binding protein, partial [Solirubrobacteraceae bacterium]|nr:putative transport system ATP-binding protein [Solirubrobacteraceae bacterium]
GQRQRVALARALQSDPPVLVLHDPTTAVDAATEYRIATRLQALRAGRTTILVTTSPALLAITTRIVVVREGRVAAEGAHADLATRDATYREVVFS